MSVLGVTIFVSTMLALFFVAGFLYHHDFSGGDPMRDSLLPFGKEGTRPTLPKLPNLPTLPVDRPKKDLPKQER